jgi:hypothetical protein
MLREMPHDKPESNSLKIQIALSCWAAAAFAWYFHQFSPVINPILRGLLHRIISPAHRIGCPALSLHGAEANPGSWLPSTFFQIPAASCAASTIC